MESCPSWSKEHDWKSCKSQNGFEGSNPLLSAKGYKAAESSHDTVALRFKLGDDYLGKLFQAYIKSYHPEILEGTAYIECISDLFFTPEVQSLKEFEQHLEINRLQHITSVSYISFRICRRLGLDWRTAARGGILHDLFYYDWRENDWSHRPHGYLHPGFALKNARDLCGPLDKKTENIIIRHMWPLTPIPPRYPEAIIVSMADKYCATKELYISLSKRYRTRFYKSIELGK